MASGDIPLCVVGSANMDLVFGCTRFPQPGETILGTRFSQHPGGKGANQAVAIARLGTRVEFVGLVGKDGFGASLRSTLANFGVGTSHLASHPAAPSGTAMILVEDSGQNEIVVAQGANGLISPEDIAASLGQLNPQIVLAQLEVPIESVEAAAKDRMMILNPAPAQPLPAGLFHGLFAIVPNEWETEQLTGVHPSDPAGCRKAAEWFHKSGVQNVILTLGERGSYWSNGKDECFVPAFSVRAIDTTAAGDAFVGGLAVAIAEGQTWESGLRFSNAVAAIAVTRHGAQESMPTRVEVDSLLGPA